MPRLGRKTTVGIFHSMSGRTAMKHAIEIGWRWDALMLFDPPNVPPPSHPRYELMGVFENRLTEWALGRRRRFAAVDELANEYLASRATKGWVAGAHELMARSVLRRRPDGDGYVLVCAPENEAGDLCRGADTQSVAARRRVRRAGQADRRRSQPQGRTRDRADQPCARHRERLRLLLRRRHRPPAADREAGGVRPAGRRIRQGMRAVRSSSWQ